MGTGSVKVRKWARWVATFVGFPLGGVAARLAVGDIDSSTTAVVGGAVAGAVHGLAQAAIGGIDRARWPHWVAATAAGFGVGLGLGAAAVGFETDTASLVVMGAITGAGVGLAQAMAVPMRVIDRLSWALTTPALWALGWLITSQVIVDADRQHAVFGSSGAITVSAVAGLLHLARRSPAESTNPTFTPSITSAVAR
jgi:hypothetical protein